VSERYTVGDLARAAKVTVRTLHHYDEIGLLRPSTRDSAGYRCYDHDDLMRLQRILAYRGLGFGLSQIATILDDPATDPVAHLRAQHVAVTGQLERLRAQLMAIERTMEAHQMGINLTPDEMFEVFGDFDPVEHAREAEQRWGDSAAYRQSAQRASTYGKADWAGIRRETSEVEQQLLAAMTSGARADSAAATAAAEAHRQNISRWFYDCDHVMHRALATRYVEDPRFAAHYEALAPGLAAYVRDAIWANADRARAAEG